MKERAVAIFIGLIMVLSTIGFAVNRSAIFSNGEGQENPLSSANIIDRVLTPEEKIYVLRTGRVIIENFYTDNCSICKENKEVLESFVGKFKGYVLLENVLNNDTVYIKMIGRGGDIEKFEDAANLTVNEDMLMEKFCNLALLQPRECLLREI
jgi:thiol:disulfide interchange protein